MSRKEYMNQLAYLLQDLPEDERQEALDYYEDYFEEAGPEEEAHVIQTLGSPEKVAAIIRESVTGGNDEAGEYTETGYEDARYREYDKVPEVTNHQGSYRGQAGNLWNRFMEWAQGKWVLILIAAVIALPIILPLVGSIIGVVFGIFGTVIGIAVAIVAGMIGMLVTGVALIPIGIGKIMVSPGLGFLLLGGGLISMAVGILLLLLCIWIVRTLLPKAVSMLAQWWRSVFRKGGSCA